MSSLPDLLSDARAAVAQGELAGAVALVQQRGQVVFAEAIGQRDLRTGAPAARDTLFRIASLTKPVTAVAALQLVDEGRLELDAPISAVLPELGNLRVLPREDAALEERRPAPRPLSARDLLTHRAGLGYAEMLSGPIAAAYAALGPQLDNPRSPADWLAALGALPLADPPGARFRYGHAFDVLGFLIARIDGRPLGEVLQQRIFGPLSMNDTGFELSAAQQGRRAGLCGFDEDGALAPLDRAPGGHARDDRPPGLAFQSGGQGLWSTVDDYAAFAGALLDGGQSRGVQLLQPETLQLLRSNQLTEAQRAEATLFGMPLFAGHGYGMGVSVVVDPTCADPMRGGGGVGTLGWPGAYGSWWQADPTTDTVMVFFCHVMAELEQLAMGIGLGGWGAVAGFHAAASEAFGAAS